MKPWLTAVILNVALAAGVAIASAAQAVTVGGGGAARPSAGFGGHAFGFHRAPGFHHRFLPPRHLFHQSHFDFGAGFASRRLSEETGAFGDYAGAYGDDYDSYADEDIENLHFRVQEPFGPGDIGQPPRSADEDAPYLPDRMDSRRGDAPDW